MGELKRRQIGQILRTCVTEHDWSRPVESLLPVVAGRDLKPLAAAATFHGVASFVHLSLRNLDGLDVNAGEALERAYLMGLGRHLRALADLNQFGTLLTEAGIPWLTFKGPVLAELVYPRADLRSYGDLDLLIPPSHFGRAVQVLEERGLELLDRNWDLILAEQRGQLHLVLPFGTTADLHWHLLNRASIRSSLSIATEEVIERAQRVHLGATEVLTLDPVDTLLHLCVHTALSGGDRLLWFKDIERTIAAGRYSWDEVLTRARVWRVGGIVAAMLHRSVAVGADVPAEVIRALVPSKVGRSLLAAVDRVLPPELTSESSHAVKLFTIGLRNSAVPNLAAVVVHVRGQGRLRTIRRDFEKEDCSTDGRLPALLPSGGEEIRQKYFKGVGKGTERQP